MEVHTDIEEQDSEVGVENGADTVVVGAVDHCIEQALGGFQRLGMFHRLVDTLRKSSSLDLGHSAVRRETK